MGLLDYYRQFAGMSDEEIGRELRDRADERRRLALAKVEVLDLSQSVWHEFPHPDVVAAITFSARRALNRPPDQEAVELRAELARRTGLEVERVVAGHGIAQLLQSALRALIDPEDEVVLPWPTWSVLPGLVRRAGGRAVPVRGTRPSAADLLEAVNPRTRAVALCTPNDPTGTIWPVAELLALAGHLPDRAWLLVDEALVDFTLDPTATLELLDELPRVILFRTLSKAYGLAGLRCGWALGPVDAGELMSRLAPAGGLSTPVQDGAREALLKCGPLVAARREGIDRERARILAELGGERYDIAPGAGHLLWIRLAGLNAAQLAGRLERFGVQVAPGALWDDDDHVRAQLQSPGATDRLVEALRRVAE